MKVFAKSRRLKITDYAHKRRNPHQKRTPTIAILRVNLIGRWEENLNVFTLAFQDLTFVKFYLNPPEPKRQLIAFHSVLHLLFCSRTCSFTSTLYIS